MTCCWWRQNQLSRWSRITSCFPHWNSIYFEEYHFRCKKGSTINFMRPQRFILGLSDGVSRVHANKYEAFTPRHYTTIQSTCKSIQRWIFLHKNQKLMYGLKLTPVLAYNNSFKNLSPHGYVPWKYYTGLWQHATKKKHSFALALLASNIFPILMLNISWTLLNNITKSPWTLKGRTTLDWTLTRITTRNMSKLPWQLK